MKRTVAAGLATAVTLSLAPYAAADPAPFTRVELNQPANQVIAVEARFNLTSDQEIGVRELRKLRGAVWDQNVPFNGQPIRTVAAKQGLTTREAYVNAIVADQGYALISLQRAAEAAVKFKHDRPYNATCYGNCGKESTATVGGKGGYGQNLSGSASMSYAMQSWGTNEIPALKRLNGRWSDNQANLTGHLHNFINPSVTRVGFASVQTAEGQASAAAVGFTGTDVTSFPQGQRTEVLHRPANQGEAPNLLAKKLSVKAPVAAPQTTGDSQATTIVGVILAILAILSAIYKFIEPMLKR